MFSFVALRAVRCTRTRIPTKTGCDSLFSVGQGARVLVYTNHLRKTGADDLTTDTATLVFADVVESVRLVDADEKVAISRIRSLVDQLTQLAEASNAGTVVENRGDGVLVRFADARGAVRFAHRAHQLSGSRDKAIAGSTYPLQLRVGVHSGSFLTDGQRYFGREINLAARIASLANPGETTLSESARADVVCGYDGDIEDLGMCYVKHVDQPVRAFRVREGGSALAGIEGLSPPAERALRPALIVLPLQRTDMAGSFQGTKFFGVGEVFAERLTAHLSRSSTVDVISTQTALGFRACWQEAARIGRTVGADYVCGGTFCPSSKGLELRLEILRTTDGATVWDAVSTCGEGDIVCSDSEVAGTVAAAISRYVVDLALTSAAAPCLSTVPGHALYLAAISTMHRFARHEFESALPMLEQLQERAPRHSDVLAWIARWHVLRVVQGWTHDANHDSLRALSFADRALDRNPDSSLALTVRGSAEIGLRGEIGNGLELYEQALRLNPNESLAWLLKSVADGIWGNVDAAENAAATAGKLASLHPYGFYYDSLRSTSALFALAYGRAEALAKRAISANALHGSAYRALAIAQSMEGRGEEARATIRSLLRVEPHCTLDHVRHRYGSRAGTHEVFIEALRQSGLPETKSTVQITTTGGMA